MKKTARVFLILIMIAVLSIAAIYILSPDSSQTVSPVSPEQIAQTVRLMESITFSSQEYQLEPGEQLTPQPVIQPEGSSELPCWSSSDELVVTVDESGTLTAVGIGQAVITASGQNCSAELLVSVSNSTDWREQTTSMIAQLAVECGTGTTYVDAQLLCERLSNSRTDEAAIMHELLSAILAQSSGKGSREQLIAAIDAAGADETVCLTAANVCWAKHEVLTSDAVLSFVGDVTLSRYNESAGSERFPAVYAASGSSVYPFDRVRGIFSCDSLTTVNFEGTLTGSTSHRDKTFYFRGDPLYASILPASSIEAAGLANNHSGDYYDVGFSDTVKYLQNASVSVFYENQPLSVEISSYSGKLSVVMLGIMHTGDEIPNDTLDAILSTVRQYDTSDTVVVVNIHWGVESATLPTASQQRAAHAMIDAGADLIIGHHPHVLQGIECYNGRYIAYSLGNFCFGGNASANSPETVILRAKIGSENGGPAVTGISVVPCYTTSSGTKRNNYQPCIRFGSDGQQVINTLLRRSAGLDYGIDSVEYSGL